MGSGSSESLFVLIDRYAQEPLEWTFVPDFEPLAELGFETLCGESPSYATSVRGSRVFRKVSAIDL